MISHTGSRCSLFAALSLALAYIGGAGARARRLETKTTTRCSWVPLWSTSQHQLPALHPSVPCLPRGRRRWLPPEIEDVPSRELTDAAHKAGVRVLLSLGGWGWDRQFASIVSIPEAEERYVKSVIAIVEDYDYDGIDLDWEYPDTAMEVAGFERLSRRLRRKIDAIGTTKGRPMILTMAASANPGTLKWLDTAFLLETMDWVNVMTYDFTGDWTNYAGHHSPLSASSKQPGGSPRSIGADHEVPVEERALPAGRLAVGIPLYGRGFGVSAPYQSTKDVARTRLPQGTTTTSTSSCTTRGGPGAGTMRPRIPGSSTPTARS